MEIQTRNCASILGTVESPKLLEGLFDTKTVITAITYLDIICHNLANSEINIKLLEKNIIIILNVFGNF